MAQNRFLHQLEYKYIQNTKKDEINMKEKTRKIEFTERELKTIEMLASGYNDPEIAEYFNISIHTIRSILTQLYRKTNTVNRTQLVAWAFRAKLVD